MVRVISWAIVFSLSTAISITLLGDRNLISGNLLDVKNLIRLIFHAKFILSFVFALVSRFSFIFMNNSLLKIERLAENSTTITAFVSAMSFIFIVLANYLFLDERLNLQQCLGALLVMVGIWVILK